MKIRDGCFTHAYIEEHVECFMYKCMTEDLLLLCPNIGDESDICKLCTLFDSMGCLKSKCIVVSFIMGMR